MTFGKPGPKQPGFSVQEATMAKILMPKATAVWLIDNTTLTFEQIADFCELHPLEVRGIADGEVAENMRGADPVASGELTREEIQKGETDKSYREHCTHCSNVPRKSGPISVRQWAGSRGGDAVFCSPACSSGESSRRTAFGRRPTMAV
jgi:hypothetical protein